MNLNTNGGLNTCKPNRFLWIFVLVKMKIIWRQIKRNALLEQISSGNATGVFINQHRNQSDRCVAPGSWSQW